MKIKYSFSYLFRKHVLLRVLCIIALCLAIIGFTALVSYTVTEKPVILSVSQQVGSPGDVISIHGKFFNNAKGNSYVEIAGNRLTESSYISWSDDEIVITIPANIQDGLIYVVSTEGRSNPDFFANKMTIPVSVHEDETYTLPAITAISSDTLYIGERLVITGKNFGTKKASSHIWFSTKKTQQQIAETAFSASKQPEEYEYIHESDADFDCEYWSDSEIRVFVPDGAATGNVYVENEYGKSAKHALTVRQRAGEKTYITKNMYSIQVTADVSNIQGTKDSLLTFRLPLPQTNAEQPNVILTESSPKPLLENYDNTSVFQIAMTQTGKNSYAATEKTKLTQSHVITVRSAETNIDVNYVQIPKNTNRMLYTMYTKADDIVPSGAPELESLLPGIVFNSVNPYRKARLLYDYMIKNFKIQDKIKKGDVNPLGMLKSKRGDAYDFAVLYTAMLRTAGVPAKLMSGILVDADKKTRAHWWVNFYVDDFGWVPADPALGAGLEYNAFQSHENPAQYYFGNIDSQHIMFSQNWNSVKNAILNGKAISIPKMYASQSIWEEMTLDVTSYSSFWNTPVVIGIY